MTTPTPDDDPVTERFEPIPVDRVPPAFEPPPEPRPAGAPPVPPTAFALPEPGGIPTQPVIAGTPVVAGSFSGPQAVRQGGSARVLNLVLGIAVLVAVAGISFAIGRTSAPGGTAGVSSTGTVPNANSGAGPLTGRDPNASFDLNGNGGPGTDPDGDRGFFGGRPFGIGGLGIEGTVQSVDGTGVTIRTADGATITVGIDGSTRYHRQVDAQASDVQAGRTVIITLADGFWPGRGSGANGSISLGTAGSITVVP
ncbi:MAG TPA: hypothetical protein VGK16_15445 [Candidatus Limnocylindrales bacterium]|jgi:hypothetical protein